MNAEFRILKNGYDRFQVDQKLQKYQEEFVQLQTKVQMYEQQLDTIQQQFDESQQRVQVLQTDLANREKVFRDLNDQAFRQANAIVETANQEAQLMVSQAVSTAKLLLAQLAKLMNETREVDANLQQQFDDLSQTIQNLQNQQLEISPNRED
ncbi:MAG TPA: hypothetical protein GX741_04955 [Erysipelothrix sp.]|nr:hypothetical protein [Erysipelothrix sp.]